MAQPERQKKVWAEEEEEEAEEEEEDDEASHPGNALQPEPSKSVYTLEGIIQGPIPKI